MPRPDLFGLPTTFLTTIGGIAVDAVITDAITHQNVLSRNPRESGEPVSHNKVRQPFRYQAEVRISDTPNRVNLIATGSQFSAIADAFANLGRPGRARAVYEALLQLDNSNEFVTVVHDLAVMRNLLFEEIEVPRTARDGRSIRINTILSETIVTNENAVEGPPESVAFEIRHASFEPVNLGFQALQFVPGLAAAAATAL